MKWERPNSKITKHNHTIPVETISVSVCFTKNKMCGSILQGRAVFCSAKNSPPTFSRISCKMVDVLHLILSKDSIQQLCIPDVAWCQHEKPPSGVGSCHREGANKSNWSLLSCCLFEIACFRFPTCNDFYLVFSWMLNETFGKIWSSSFNEGHPLRHIGSKAPWQVIQRQDSHPQITAMPGNLMTRWTSKTFGWWTWYDTAMGFWDSNWYARYLHLFQKHDDLKSDYDSSHLKINMTFLD